MGDNIAQKTEKAIASINKGADKKEEMRMMMAPYADWDRFLSPAPVTIALLGQLILISTDTDFSLLDKDKTVKFELLKYPDSFRASLVQVSNRGWVAFNKAHTCMDQIRLYSGNVDKHVKTAVKFLISGTPQEVELMVPDALKSIENIADECAELATSVENEFAMVMEMVGELLAATTRAKGQHEEDLKATEIALKIAEQNKTALEEQKQQAEEQRKKMERQMTEAQDDYKEAMDSMTGALSMIGMACADVLVSTTRIIPNFMSMVKSRWFSNESQGSEDKVASAEQPISQIQGDDKHEIFKLVPEIHKEITALFELACGGRSSEGEDAPSWNEIPSNDGAEYTKQMLNSIVKRKLKAFDKSKTKTKLEKVCSEGMETCEKLLALTKGMRKDEKEIEEVMTKARSLLLEVETLNTASHTVLGGNALPNKSPCLSKQQMNQNDGGDDGLVMSTVRNYRFKTETAKEMLKDSRRMYEKASDDVEKRTKEMGEILADLAKINLQKIDHETIRDTLIKGIHALAKLREQWGKIVQFFQMLSNLVKCSLNTSLKTFVSTSQNQKKLTEAGRAMSDTMRDVIFEQAFQASQIAYVVNSISSVYVEVSGKHLMDRITCLGELIALDPVKDARKIQQKRQELNQSCEAAHDAITRLALKKKKEITEALDKRIGRIENEVEPLLPPISEIEAKEIQDQVKAGVAMGKEAMEEEVDDLIG